MDIWKLARVLCKDIYLYGTRTELKKDYKLYSQISGSSGSIMDNIAEGFERDGRKEFMQFLSIAKASCGETRSQLYRVYDRGYLSKEEFEIMKSQCITLSKKIGAFINYLSKSDYRGLKYKS